MWATIAGLGAGLAGSVIGGIQASKAAKKAEKQLQAEKQSNQDWYNRRYYQDYAQTAEAQNLLNNTRQQAQEWLKNAAGRARVGGGSAEEVAAAVENAGKAQADAASSIAAQATQYKSGVENAYRQQDKAINDAQISVYNQQAQNSTNAANAAMKAGMDLAGMDMQSKLKTGKGLFANMFKA